MQERHKDRSLYFKELVSTTEKYFIPYIERFHKIEAGTCVLEIGCGEGGNLLPFSRIGCETIGVDMAEGKIEDAIRFFKEANVEGTFIASDIFKIKELENQFDLIICHDVLEHIENKALFLSNVQKYLKKDGIVFMSFPAWQMPFGGHQQGCQNKIVSHLPFIHLLPASLYKAILKSGGENENCINELLEIKETKLPIEKFEKLINEQHLKIIDRELFFINPHYETKFGLKPRKLSPVVSSIPHIRNFFTTSCFYMLKF